MFFRTYFTFIKSSILIYFIYKSRPCLGCVCFGWFLCWHQSQVTCMEQVFFKDLSVFGCVHPCFYSGQLPCLCCWETPPQPDAAATMLHRGDGISQMVNSTWWSPDIVLGVLPKDFSFCLIRPENHFPSCCLSSATLKYLCPQGLSEESLLSVASCLPIIEIFDFIRFN